MTAADLLIKSVLEGGPYAVSVLGWLAWVYERRQNKESTDRLLELATAQIEATVKNEAAVGANVKLMERLLAQVTHGPKD